MRLNKKKILLIGSNGFFGKNFYNKFKTIFIIKKANRKTNIFKLNFKNYDYIINCAAEVYNERLMFKNNTYLVYKIIDKYLTDNSSAKIIHFGSSSEYGKYGRPTSELDVLKPSTTYEGTKGAATLLLQGLSQNFQIPCIIFRPYSIYGPMENASRLIPTIFRHFLYNEKLIVYNGYHDFVYIDDISNIIFNICKKWIKTAYGEIINLGTGKQYSNYQVLKLCEKVLKKKSNAIIRKGFQRVYDNPKWLSNASKMKKYNIKLDTSLEDGIKKYWKYLIQNKGKKILFSKKNNFKKMY